MTTAVTKRSLTRRVESLPLNLPAGTRRVGCWLDDGDFTDGEVRLVIEVDFGNGFQFAGSADAKPGRNTRGIPSGLFLTYSDDPSAERPVELKAVRYSVTPIRGAPIVGLERLD